MHIGGVCDKVGELTLKGDASCSPKVNELVAIACAIIDSAKTSNSSIEINKLQVCLLTFFVFFVYLINLTQCD